MNIPPNPVTFSHHALELLAGGNTNSSGLKNEETAGHVAKSFANHLHNLAQKQEPDSASSLNQCAEDLAFCSHVQEECFYAIGPDTTKYEPQRVNILVNEVLDSLQERGRVLIPCGPQTHAMLMEIALSEDQHQSEVAPTYDIRTHNSGSGQLAHHQSALINDKLKFSSFTVEQVQLGPLSSQIGKNSIEGLFITCWSGNKGVDDIYAWAKSKGIAVDTPKAAPYRASQKFSTCATDCIKAYLRNNLDHQDYLTSKIELINTLEDLEEFQILTPDLQKDLSHAKTKAQAKIDSLQLFQASFEQTSEIPKNWLEDLSTAQLDSLTQVVEHHLSSLTFLDKSTESKIQHIYDLCEAKEFSKGSKSLERGCDLQLKNEKNHQMRLQMLMVKKGSYKIDALENPNPKQDQAEDSDTSLNDESEWV